MKLDMEGKIKLKKVRAKFRRNQVEMEGKNEIFIKITNNPVPAPWLT